MFKMELHNQQFISAYIAFKEAKMNKHCHLYSEILDKLVNPCKLIILASTNISNEDHCKFWMNDILPLVFNSNKNIQEKALTLLTVIQPKLKSVKYDKQTSWNEIKEKILEEYLENIKNLIKATNSIWHKIWCLFVKLLDRDLIHATIINRFLAVVEIGFRSINCRIRAEAFICWKALVEVFVEHHEIFSPKRIKLISIPLRSTKSKNLECAARKFHVWWYFICEIIPELEKYVDMVFDPFLTFCFGLNDTKNRKQYVNKNWAIYALIDCLEKDNDIDCKLKESNLEIPLETVINLDIIQRSEKLMDACFEGIRILSEKKDSNILLNKLWNYLHIKIKEIRNFAVYEKCFKSLKKLFENDITNNKSLLNFLALILENLINENSLSLIQYTNVKSNQIYELIVSLIEMIYKTELLSVPEKGDVLLRKIIELSDYSHSRDLPQYWNLLKKLMQWVISEENTLTYNVKRQIWKYLNISVKNYMINQSFEFRLEVKASIVNKWLIWPLAAVPNNGNKKFLKFDNEMLSEWKGTAEIASKAEGKPNFIGYMTKLLRSCSENSNTIANFSIIYSYLIEMFPTDFDESTKPILKFIITFISTPLQSGYENFNCIVLSLVNYIKQIGENEVELLFNELKALLKSIIEIENSSSISKNVSAEFKKAFQDRLKSMKRKDKNFYKEVRDIINSDSNEFVRIPKTVTIDVEKLTEHQKEKLKEKRTDIPALYSNTSREASQSQDTLKMFLFNTTSKPKVIEDKHIKSVIDPKNIKNQNALKNQSAEIENTKIDQKLEESVLENEILTQVNEKVIQIDEKSHPSKNPLKKDLIKSELKNREILNITPNSNSSLSDEKNGDICLLEKKGQNFRKNDLKLLNSFNIDINDKKATSILKKLKALEINTVEGNAVLAGKLRKRNKEDDQENRKNENKKQKKMNTSQSNDKIQHYKSISEKERKNSIQSVKELDESLETVDQKNEKQIIEKFDSNKKDSAKKILTTSANELVKTINNSIEEVIKFSQQYSEGVLFKKIPGRKSLIKTKKINLISQKKNSTKRAKIPEDPPKLNDDQISDTNNKLDEHLNNGNDQSNNKTNIPIISIKSIEKINAKTDDIILMNTEPISDSFTAILENDLLNNENVQTPIKTVLENSITDKVIEIIPNINEIEAELNTELVNTVEDDTSGIPSKFKKNECNSNFNDSSKGNDKFSNMKIDTNISIASSPEMSNTSARNEEFLNNTINISPIPLEDKSVNASDKKINTFTHDLMKLNNESPKLPVIQKNLSSPEKKACIESLANRTKTSQFTGRAAQMINMIRKTTNYIGLQKAEILNTNANNKSDQIKQIYSPPKNEENSLCHQDNNFLVFSKTLPSPSASPSVSILKRKFMRDSIEEMETPASKRKRVSFHDPPVSGRKEYLKDIDEKNSKPIQKSSLLSENAITPQDSHNKQIYFKRNSRLDSLTEISKFISTSTPKNTMEDMSSVTNCSSMESLKWNSTTENIREIEKDNAELNSANSAIISNNDIILNHNGELYKSARNITKDLITKMSKDNKLKEDILELLSENFPKEFIEYSIQENLSATVCERLNPATLVDCFIKKCKTNEELQKKLLDQMFVIFKSLNAEDSTKFIFSLLRNHQIPRADILNAVEILVERGKNDTSSTPTSL